MDNPEQRETWRGVKWLWPVGGICPKHHIPVGPVTNLCIECNNEQVTAAHEGSYEWERKSNTVIKKEEEKAERETVQDLWHDEKE